MATEDTIWVFSSSSLKALVEYSLATVGIAKLPVEVHVIVLLVPISTTSALAGWGTVSMVPRSVKAAEVLATVASVACLTRTLALTEAVPSATVQI